MLEPALKVDHRDVERDFDLYLDIAERQAIEITRDGHPSTVILSSEEYSRLEGLAAQAAREADASATTSAAAAAEQLAKKDAPSDRGG